MIRASHIALLAAFWAGTAGAEITAARYGEPTDVYGHGAIMGGEYAGLEVEIAPDRVLGTAAVGAVYEDTAPRLVDLDGDGTPEIITVISYFETGAAIRIFDEVANPDHPEETTLAVVAETDPIGRAHRWLAIAGVADLDGDGNIEIVFVDRPHLIKALRVIEVTREGDEWIIRDVAASPGFTNHHIGSPIIEGGIFECDLGPEIITADADWRRVMGTRLVGRALISREIRAYDGPGSLHCP